MPPALDLWTALGFAALFAVVLALAWRRPVAGPLALLGALPFDAPHWIGATTVTAPKVVLVAALAAAAARALDVSVVRKPPATWLIGAGLALLAATLLSMLPALDRGETVRQAFKAAEYLVALFLGAVAFAADPDARATRATLAGALLLVASLALIELLGGATTSVAPAAGLLLPRVAGPLEGPNQLAGYLGLLLPFPIVYAARGQAWMLERAAIGVACAAVLLTLSRAGIVATIVAAALAVALAPRAACDLDMAGSTRAETDAAAPPPGRARRSALTLIALGFGTGIACLAAIGIRVGGAPGGMAAVFARLSDAEPAHTGGVGHRLELWRAAWTLWRAHPLLGVGAGNFERRLGSVGLNGVRTHANSLYLQALVEGGLPLLAATLFWVWASIVPLARRVRGASPLVAAAVAASVGIALHQIADLMLFYPKVGESWCVLLGIAAAASVARVGSGVSSPADAVPSGTRAIGTSG